MWVFPLYLETDENNQNWNVMMDPRLPSQNTNLSPQSLSGSSALALMSLWIHNPNLKWVQDLLGYQALITQAQMEYQRDWWLGPSGWVQHHKELQLVLSRSHSMELGFSSSGRVNRCRQYFCLTSSLERAWNAKAQFSSKVVTHSPSHPTQYFKKFQPVAHCSFMM